MSTQLSGPVVVAAHGIYEESSAALHSLGDTVFTNDGRGFRYCEAGGTALVAGKLYQSKVENTSDADLAVAAASAGDLILTTTSTVTVDANEYAGGFVVVNTTPGLGQVLKIKSHPAASAAVVVITLEDAVQVALTTVSRISLVANAYKDVIVNPITQTSAPVGAAVKAITADFFGWLGVSGLQPVTAQGGLTVGLDLVATDDTTAGAVEVIADGSAELLPKVGTAVMTIATADVGLAMLKLL